jgi:hypothetical protein
MTRFSGGEFVDGATALGYEEALETLLGFVGRPVLVLFSGAGRAPFVCGVLSGRLDRGELDERLQEVLLRADDTAVETLFFHVGSRQMGFVVRPDEFQRAFLVGEGQLVLELGSCAVSVLLRGELGHALER